MIKFFVFKNLHIFKHWEKFFPFIQSFTLNVLSEYIFWFVFHLGLNVKQFSNLTFDRPTCYNIDLGLAGIKNWLVSSLTFYRIFHPISFYSLDLTRGFMGHSYHIKTQKIASICKIPLPWLILLLSVWATPAKM